MALGILDFNFQAIYYKASFNPEPESKGANLHDSNEYLEMIRALIP